MKLSKEVKYHLINSALAGALTLFGAFTTGEISWKSFLAAFCAAAIVAITKFKTYWEKAPIKTKKKAQAALFNFI